MTIEKVAVIGAGLMGSGIAQVIANAGFEVTLRSRRGKHGIEKLHENIQRAISKQILSKENAATLLSNVNYTTSLTKAVKDADLIIEAVVEDLTIKRKIFETIDTYSKQNAILASNTSALSIGKLAQVTMNPNRVLGMHFFNPAPVMNLIEVVVTPNTSEEAINSVVEFSKRSTNFH